jgi:hypothetical protein
MMSGKILLTGGGVQLIVFVAVIREIFKKEIYRCDKKLRGAIEIKGSVWGRGLESGGNMNVQHLIYECMSLEFFATDDCVKGSGGYLVHNYSRRGYPPHENNVGWGTLSLGDQKSWVHEICE